MICHLCEVHGDWSLSMDNTEISSEKNKVGQKSAILKWKFKQKMNTNVVDGLNWKVPPQSLLLDQICVQWTTPPYLEKTNHYSVKEFIWASILVDEIITNKGRVKQRRPSQLLSILCSRFYCGIQALYWPVKWLWFPTIHEQYISQQYSKLVLVERNPCITCSSSNASPVGISSVYSSLINTTDSKLDLAKITLKKMVKFKNYTLTSWEDATERAIFAASASLSAPITVTYTP